MSARGGDGDRRGDRDYLVGWRLSRHPDRRLTDGNRRASAEPPDLVDGTEDNGRLGDADEQGSGDHRGQLAVRRTAIQSLGGASSPEHRPRARRVYGWIYQGAVIRTRHETSHHE